MATNCYEIIQILQDEALKLFELALTNAYKKMDQIADQATTRMNQLFRDLASTQKNLDEQLERIQKNTLAVIRSLVKETEKYIQNIWDVTKGKIFRIVGVAGSEMESSNSSTKIEEFANFMSIKIKEFNEKIRVYADGIISTQEQCFINLKERLETKTE